ncbi:MAG TPA: HD domain-containing protein [Candidatus Peribacteraceae bacterium]|nr:HD domain-containing protein [Candidatus Peribacteraceae bacterium]
MVPSSAQAALQSYPLSPGVRKKLDRVIAFGKKHLSEMKRRTGETYVDHGLEVAQVLCELSESHELLSIAVLHDLLVHPNGEELLRQSPLSEEERSIVTEMHRLRRLHIDADTHDLDRVLDAFVKDHRMLVLRMAHRLNDVRHLQRFAGKLRREVANETLHMYTAIAGRMGFHKWRYEMEDICFLLLYPKAANHLQGLFDGARRLDEACLRHAQKYLQERFHESGIISAIDWRIKGLYSTYRKMIVRQRSFAELTDRLALRILVSNIEDCYHALGLVHGRMHPIPGKLKDYIGAPKENGYRSIHTVVYPLPGVTEQPIEIQIRTYEMHRECEEGGSSHTAYKDLSYALRSPPARVHLFRNLESLRAEARSPKQFEQALRTYFREDRIMVFDTDNNLYHLKKPSSVLDFGWMAVGMRVHSLKAARVNGRKQGFETLLHDGDTVELQFGRGRQLKREWLNACKQAVVRRALRAMMRGKDQTQQFQLSPSESQK